MVLSAGSGLLKYVSVLSTLTWSIRLLLPFAAHLVVWGK